MAGLRVTTVNPDVEYVWTDISPTWRAELVGDLVVINKDTSPWAFVTTPSGTQVRIRREHIVSIEEW